MPRLGRPGRKQKSLTARVIQGSLKITFSAETIRAKFSGIIDAGPAKLIFSPRFALDSGGRRELLHFSVPHRKLWKSLMRVHLGDYEKLDRQLKRNIAHVDSA